ncbi:hypothetical protein RsoM2USA_335 [Ralstonia phage RsoM2USA]|nr:hypothetical protein RsoM2USA_335 [Ralstonia phage RsoM2USA]
MKLQEITNNNSPVGAWMAACADRGYTTTIDNRHRLENGVLHIDGNLQIRSHGNLPFPQMPFKLGDVKILLLRNLDLTDSDFSWQPQSCDLITFDYCKLPEIKNELFGNVGELGIDSLESDIPRISHDMYTEEFPFIYRLYKRVDAGIPEFSLTVEGSWIQVTDGNNEIKFDDLFTFQDYLTNHPNEKLQSLMI